MSCGLKSGDCRYMIDGSYSCGITNSVDPNSVPVGILEGFTGEVVDRVKQVACQMMPGVSMCKEGGSLDAAGKRMDRPQHLP